MQHQIFSYRWQRPVAKEYIENALLLFHGNSGYANAPHRYVCTYIANLVTVESKRKPRIILLY
jgi:hypothetical protein